MRGWLRLRLTRLSASKETDGERHQTEAFDAAEAFRVASDVPRTTTEARARDRAEVEGEGRGALAADESECSASTSSRR